MAKKNKPYTLCHFLDSWKYFQHVLFLDLGCPSSWVGDKFCDDGCNNAANNFDNGDCCGPNVNKQYCTKCECLSGGGGGSSTGKRFLSESFVWNYVFVDANVTMDSPDILGMHQRVKKSDTSDLTRPSIRDFKWDNV